MHRKVVTVLFCDVVGSTALGESGDPEALQALLARYFEHMKAIVERHGGWVEKFIGDAVMAVFGVPGEETERPWRQVQARVLAHPGDHAPAETPAREAIAILERADGLTAQGDGYLDLGDVLITAGRVDAAVEAYEQALERYERKQNLAMAAQVERRLEAVRTQTV